jgi:hypothetical protein
LSNYLDITGGLAAAGLGREFEPGLSLRMSPTGGTRLIERERGEESWSARGRREKKMAGWDGSCGRKGRGRGRPG